MERNLIVTATATKTDGTNILPTNNSLQQDKTAEPMGSNPSADSPAVGKLQDKLAKDLVRIFKLLSDETRLRILYSLSQAEELHVRALCELLQKLLCFVLSVFVSIRSLDHRQVH